MNLTSILQVIDSSLAVPWTAFAVGLAGGFGLGVAASRRRIHRQRPNKEIVGTWRAALPSFPMVLATLLWGLLFGLLAARFIPH